MNSDPGIGNPITIMFTYRGMYENCHGGKKRKLGNDERTKLATDLVHGKLSASRVQKKLAASMMDFGDPEPASIPSLNALRIIKCRTKCSGQLDPDPILAVIKMKNTEPYNTIFKDIGYDPFFIHYWSAAQTNCYRIYTRTNKLPRVSIDATGSLVRRINLLSGRRTKAIFLYEVAVYDEKTRSQFSVTNMLSERHNNIAIAFWLMSWMREDIKPPRICVTDQSRALMMACTRAFTQYRTFEEYLSACSALLIQNECHREKPLCMIRNDFAHVIHLISTWPEIKNASPRSKKFYLQTAASLIACISFNDAKKLLKSIFTVLLNEEEGFDENDVPTPCETAKNHLKDLIAVGLRQDPLPDNIVSELLNNSKETEATTDISESETIDDINENTELEVNTSSRPNDVIEEIKEIYDHCVEESGTYEGDRDNAQYCPTLAKKFLDFCDLIVVWSGIMVPVFGYGRPTETSSSSESQFKELKIDILRDEVLPIRLDELLKIQIESVIGKCNIVGARFKNESAEGNEENPEMSTKATKNELLTNEAEENWRGQNTTSNNKKSARNKKRNYLEPDPTILFTDLRSKTKCPVVGHLLNGNISKLKSVKISNCHYTLMNTCTFDTITQILFCAYADSRQYSNFIDSIANDTDGLYFTLIRNAVRDGTTVQCYRKRAQILVGIENFKKQKLGSSITVNSACTAVFLVNHLFSLQPSLTETKECRVCNVERTRRGTTVTINLPTDDGFASFRRAVASYFDDVLQCRKCSSEVRRDVVLNKHLFIEVVSVGSYPNDTLNIKLEETERRLVILDRTFILRGIVSFIAPESENMNAIGHYKAYCWRSESKKWEMHDDLQPTSKFTRSTARIPAQLFIYTQ